MAKKMINFTFEVVANTFPGEVVGVTGDSEELGNWDPHSSVFLQPNTLQSADIDLPERSNIWRCVVTVPRKSSIKYRYFTCFFPDAPKDPMNVIISRSEANHEPRMWVQSDELFNDVKLCDTFGFIDARRDCINKGCLTTQTEVNLRLVPGCISFENEDMLITSIRCSPFEMGPEKTQRAIQSWSQLLTYTLNKTNYSPTSQKDACLYHPNDVMMFEIQVIKMENLGFKFDFYGISSKCDKAFSSDNHIGYSCILPSALKGSLGQTTTFISSMDHKMEGEFTVNYSIIKPLVGYHCSLDLTCPKTLNYRNYPINIGHRGMGSSFNMTAPVMENTIASFNAAGQYGAQCVEMDVHLTKDLVPVIYHDFTVHVALEKKDRNAAANNYTCMSVKNLTLDELKTLKLFHRVSDQWASISEGDNKHELPFPTLIECLEEVKENIGFYIELKYPSQLENGEYEDSTMYDANQFCDVILTTILKHCGNRQILLATFEPDLCIMLNLKQNKFPVLFLTQGETKTWPPYKDLRTQTVETAIRFAKAECLYAICALTENLLKNDNLIKMCHENNLPLLSWGNDNDNHANLKFLTQKELTGLVYNRMDLYGPGAPSKNV